MLRRGTSFVSNRGAVHPAFLQTVLISFITIFNHCRWVTTLTTHCKASHSPCRNYTVRAEQRQMCVRPFFSPSADLTNLFGLQDYEFCTCRLCMLLSRFFHIATSGATPTTLLLKLVRSVLHYPHSFGPTLVFRAVYEVRDYRLLIYANVLSEPRRQSP